MRQVLVACGNGHHWQLGVSDENALLFPDLSNNELIGRYGCHWCGEGYVTLVSLLDTAG